MPAVSVHHTATTDEPWDGPAAVAGMPNEEAVLKYCHAWQAPNGDRSAKGTYKFPHAKTKGGPANLAACRNGLARLAGADIPAADKPGVERHLRAHIADGGSAADDQHTPLIRGRHQVRAGHQREWYSIRNSPQGDATQVWLYDEIGLWGVTAQNFVSDFTGIRATEIALHINSPGGDVFDAIAIYNAIRRHQARVTVHVDGLAASAASFIAQAGDRVLVERNAQFMVHDAIGLCFGNASDMSEMQALLDKASDNIADIYAQRSGVDTATWRAVMRAEAWYSSEEAVLAGLADEVAALTPPDERLTARAQFDLSRFRYRDREEAPDPGAVARAAVPVGDGEPDSGPHEDLQVTVEAPPVSGRADSVPTVPPAPPAPEPASETAAPTEPAPPPAPRPVASPVVDPDLFRRTLREAVATT